MGAAAQRRGRARGAENRREPERTCIVSRAKLPPDQLIRFVRAPDGQIVPDVACRLPGRGVWVACRRASIEEAVRRNAFQRAFKASAVVPPDLAQRVDLLLKQRAASALSLANKAGQLVAGFAKVEATVEKGLAVALIHAADAAADGCEKLDRKLRAAGGNGDAALVTLLSSDELSLAIGRANVVHAALTKGGAATNFLREARRLLRYRADWDVEAARPQAAESKTGQA